MATSAVSNVMRPGGIPGWGMVGARNFHYL